MSPKKQIAGSIDEALKLRAIIEASSLYTFHIDPATGRLEFSESALNLISLEKARLAKFDDLYELVLSEDLQALKEQAESFFNRQLDRAKFEFRIVQDNKPPTWVRCHICRIMDQNAEIELVAGSLIDIAGEMNNRLIIDSSLDGTYIYDIREDASLFSGKIFDSLLLKAGYYRNGKATFMETVIPEDRDYYLNFLKEVVASKQINTSIEFRVYDENLDPVWIATRGTMHYDTDGLPYLVAGGFVNIDGLKIYNQFVKSESLVNKVSGLPNRQQFFEDLENILRHKDKNGYVIFVNVDNFRHINERYDYAVGNDFLKRMGDILGRNKLVSGGVYHYDADTFILIAENAAYDEAVSQMEYYQIISDVPFAYKNISYHYSVSMAAVAYRQSGSSADVIINKCHVAMNRVKANGKKDFIVFYDELYEEYKLKLNLDAQLRNCVLSGMKDFEVFYQPFINAADNSCLGAEALLRWRSPTGELVPPDYFIPILESLSLMDIVGAWVFKTAARQCKKWLDNYAGRPDFYISVNVSAPQLEDNNFAGDILSYLEEIGLSPANIIIELTESVLLVDFQRGMKQLLALKDSGIRLAIDDFGTGYSSLSYLKTLPVDEIKIDRSFIQDIETDNYSREFVSSIIKITQSINRIVCVEGVENATQSRILRELKADVLQGFLFSKPIPKEDFERIVF